MQSSPSHRLRRRVHENAVAFERECAGQQVWIRTAVVQEHRRIRVEMAAVAHQVDDAIEVLVDQAGEDVSEGRWASRSRRFHAIVERSRLRCDRNSARLVDTPVLAQELTNRLDRMRLPPAPPVALGATF